MLSEQGARILWKNTTQTKVKGLSRFNDFLEGVYFNGHFLTASPLNTRLRFHTMRKSMSFVSNLAVGVYRV